MKYILYRFVMLAFVLFAATGCDGEKGAAISNQKSYSSVSANPSVINSASGVSSSDATKALSVKLKVVQKLNYDWSGDGNRYEFILSIPEPWDDAGDFTELQIARNGKVVYTLTDQSGLVKYQSELGSKTISPIQNLLSSTYLFMIPSKEKTALPVLFVFGWAYGSSPGSLRVIALNNEGIPKEVFYRENFMVTAFADLNNDSRMDLIGKECLSQGWGPDLLTYDPFTVFRFGEELTSPMMLDLTLSEAYNKKEYYGWAGPKCREDVAVVMHPPGNGKPVIMDAKEAEALFTKK